MENKIIEDYNSFRIVLWSVFGVLLFVIYLSYVFFGEKVFVWNFRILCIDRRYMLGEI